MLQWYDLHPYNAVHVVRIAGALDLARLRVAVDGSLERLGLTNLRLNPDRAVFAYGGGSMSSEIKVIDQGKGVHQELELEITRQINTPFESRASFNPFRFFVVQERDVFSLGLVYFHPVADAEAIVHLLKRMVDAYTTRSVSAVDDRIDIYPSRYDNLLCRSPLLLAKKIVALPSLMRALGSSCRPPYGDLTDFTNGFALFSLPADALRSLTATSKLWDVTMNDLFLALFLKSLSFLAPDRADERRRRIAIGCIVNLRRDLALDSRRTFGLFLGSFLVSHEVPDRISLMDLAREVRRQTQAIKDDKLFLAAPLEMGIARIAASLSSIESRKRFYRKYYPLWGGITNMNLNSVWDGGGGQRPPDYFRAVSTGPVTPFVLSITTVLDWVNIGMSYRTTVFTPAQIDRVKAEFMNSLSQIVQPR